MAEGISLDHLHSRVTELEGGFSALSLAVGRLEATLPQLQKDISDVQKSQIRSDAARERQTEILSSKMDDVKDKALNSAPLWATTTIGILAMLCAAFVTAYFTR